MTPRILEGGIYDIDPDISTHAIPTDTTPQVRKHMVLVLGRKPNLKNCWRVVTITSKPYDLHAPNDRLENYIPIAPVPKKPYDMQVQLAHGATLLLDSYLRIDREWYVHADGLQGLGVGDTGLALRVRKKGSGGLAQLRDYLRRKEREKIAAVTEKEEKKEDKDEVGSLGLEGLVI
ncbi:hypothetical protein CC80DRAFT_190163 [Byssothecium circinans]|uniref:Uncharacterized protein n=1 Tax=Byssothecium circinans TaxID=147558 RepID=A0A6A5TID9_9PLEO|nr:hypothetical protein CC80DRAFT_190163 [Byssothecium circinans]